MAEERDDKILDIYNSKLFEQYSDKSKHFQRTFTLVVGISSFFFLMILFPYFSLKYEYNSISQFNPIMNSMSKVTTQLNGIINDTEMIQNSIRSFHDTGVKWYQDLENSSQQLQVIEYLKEQFNLTLSNSTLQQNLFEKFTEEKGIHCALFPFGTLNWTKCNSSFVANDYENRTQNIVKNIQKQITELVNKVDIQINQLNNTISSTNSDIDHLRYLSHFGINTSNLRSFFIDSKNNLTTMHTYLKGINESLNNFSFYQFQGYSTVPTQQEFERKLEDAIHTLQIAEQSIEQSKNNILDQKTRINSIAQKIADRLEQPSSPVGTLPVGFDELVLVFPIALAGGFFVCNSSFIDAIRLRKEFQDFYKDSGKNSITDQQISSIAPLWLDPLRREQNKKARFAIFLIPFVIFVAACVLILYSWTGPNMSIGGEYTNRYVFAGLYLLSGGLFVYGYLKTIKEYRHYINENASNLRKRQQLQSQIDNSINSVNNNIDNTMRYDTTKDVSESHRLEVEKHSSDRPHALQSKEDFSLPIAEKKQHKYNLTVHHLFQRKNLKLLILVITVSLVSSIIGLVVLNTITPSEPTINDRDNVKVNKYSFINQWGSEGGGDGQFYDSQGIAIDSSGNVYVADSGNNRIQKFDHNGTFITKWGSEGDGNGQFNNPIDIAIDSLDNVYVADPLNDSVQKFDSNGTFITKWGSYGLGDGQFKYTSGIAVDQRTGNVYVADTHINRIQKFDSNGTFITKWGSEGGGDGQFNRTSGIAVDQRTGNVYVADYYNNRIQKFDSNGNFIATWEHENPSTIAVDSSGYVYISFSFSDDIHIQKFDSNGNFITEWGSQGTGDGQFESKGDLQRIAIDSSGNVYILGDNRIQKFDSNGTFITKWGSEGDGNGQFSDPEGIAIDSSGYVYVADSNNDLIQVFSRQE